MKYVTKIHGFKWPDLMVESWDIAEQIIQLIQCDGFKVHGLKCKIAEEIKILK